MSEPTFHRLFCIHHAECVAEALSERGHWAAVYTGRVPLTDAMDGHYVLTTAPADELLAVRNEVLAENRAQSEALGCSWPAPRYEALPPERVSPGAHARRQYEEWRRDCAAA